MKAKHENPFDTLSELQLNSPSEADLISEKEVFAELRFSEDEIDVGGYDIKVSLVRAILHIHAWGSEISPGTRLAEKSKLENIRTETERRVSTFQHASGGSTSVGGSSAGLINATAQGHVEDQTGEIEEVEITQEINHRFVKATSGNRWLIDENATRDGEKPLQDTYIANDLLCKVAPKDNTNAISVEGLIVARKSDIYIEVGGRNRLEHEYRNRLHRDRFHRAIIAKCLAEYSGQTDDEKSRGRLIFSKSILETDPDVS